MYVQAPAFNRYEYKLSIEHCTVSTPFVHCLSLAHYASLSDALPMLTCITHYVPYFTPHLAEDWPSMLRSALSSALGIADATYDWGKAVPFV